MSETLSKAYGGEFNFFDPIKLYSAANFLTEGGFTPRGFEAAIVPTITGTLGQAVGLPWQAGAAIGGIGEQFWFSPARAAAANAALSRFGAKSAQAAAFGGKVAGEASKYGPKLAQSPMMDALNGIYTNFGINATDEDIKKLRASTINK
jgi:hypothetical protein